MMLINISNMVLQQNGEIILCKGNIALQASHAVYGVIARLARYQLQPFGGEAVNDNSPLKLQAGHDHANKRLQLRQNGLWCGLGFQVHWEHSGLQ